jgi:hypothetical protein
MNTRTTRMFSATLVAIVLMFAGDVIEGISGGMSGSTQPPSYAISARLAGIIAHDTKPKATMVGTPTFTSYAGSPAYAVTLDTGTLYVEANTGRILANTVSEAISDK